MAQPGRTIPTGYDRDFDQVLAESRNAARTNITTDVDDCDVGACRLASSLRVACSINGATVFFDDGRLERLGLTVRQSTSDLETQIA